MSIVFLTFSRQIKFFPVGKSHLHIWLIIAPTASGQRMGLPWIHIEFPCGRILNISYDFHGLATLKYASLRSTESIKQLSSIKLITFWIDSILKCSYWMFLFNFFRFKIILFLPSFLGLVNRLKAHPFGSCLDLETTFLSSSFLTSSSIVRVSSALNLSCLDIVCCGSSMNSNFNFFLYNVENPGIACNLLPVFVVINNITCYKRWIVYTYI